MKLVKSKRLRIGASAVALALVCIVAVRMFNGWRDQRAAEFGVVATVEALLHGDYATLERYQFGDELGRLGLTREQLEQYRTCLLRGYIAPDSKVTVVRQKLNLAKPRNDYERNMQAVIQRLATTNPTFYVNIDRIDGKPPLVFPTSAVRQADGWVISPAATLAWLQSGYSTDPRERYRHIADALIEAGLTGICSPSGSWLRVDRIEDYLQGRIEERQIFEE